MKNCERVMKRRKVGEVSSKYAYDPEKFTRDMQEAGERREQLWRDFVSFMIDHDVEPVELRTLFTRYYDEFID